MYGITFGFDVKNQSQLEDLCGSGQTICLDINKNSDITRYKKYAYALIDLSSRRIEEKIIVSMNGLFTAIFIRDIFYVEVYKRIITIHHKDGKTDTYARLSDIENILEIFGFVRSHRAYLVSVSAIKTLSATCITFINGEIVPVSKSCYAAIKNAFLMQKGARVV